MHSDHNEAVVRYIESCTQLVSSKFEFSRSGFLSDIKRDGIVDYQKPDDAIYDAIRAKIDEHNLADAFELMLKNKTADCFEQALLLALTLKDNPAIAEKYDFFMASVLKETADEFVHSERPHSFLVILPQDCPAKYIRPSGWSASSIPYGRHLIECPSIITADPWRNSVQTTLSFSENPLRYSTDSPNFAFTPLLIEDFKRAWIKIQSQFKSRTFDAITPPHLNAYCLSLDALTVSPTAVASHMSASAYSVATSIKDGLTEVEAFDTPKP